MRITIRHEDGNTLSGTVEQVLSSHLAKGWKLEEVEDNIEYGIQNTYTGKVGFPWPKEYVKEAETHDGMFMAVQRVRTEWESLKE